MDLFAETIAEFKRLEDEINRGTRVLSLSGLTSIAAKAFILSKLRNGGVKKPIVVITDLNKDSETWEADLNFFQNENGKDAADKPLSPPILTLPSFEADIYSGISPHAETQEERALTLWQLIQNKPDFLILPVKSVITKVPSPVKLESFGAVLNRGEDFSPDALIGRLEASGYKREEPIDNFGEYSMRGGIVDLWPPNCTTPVRIEFFGDTVDSIRSFDPDSQLSIEQLTAVSISPMREFSADSIDFKRWSELATARFDDEKFARNLRDRTEFANEGEDFSGWEFFISLLDPLSASVFDYLDECIFVIDEPAVVEQTLDSFYTRLHHAYQEITEHGEIGLAPSELFLMPEELRGKIEKSQRLELRALGRIKAQTDEEFSTEGILLEAAEADPERPGGNQRGAPLYLFSPAQKASEFQINSRPTRNFEGDIKAFAVEYANTARNPEQLTKPALFVFQSQGLAERFNDILRDYEIVLPDHLIRIGELSNGFELPSNGLTIFTESALFGDRRTSDFRARAREKFKPKRSAFISDFRDLRQGDFVVHVDHGIGRFEGLELIGTQGVEREFMLLVYADNAKLFVPVERLDLVSRYGSSEGSQPSLDRLGGIGWQKTKARAKRAMRDMADELLRLYAERKLVRGFAFSADAPWQKEFEDAFPFQLTADQSISIDEIKKDMETPAPMDRLVVGDVGYGKTEVAMRAGFKAVMDGKQVAVLTPTTILSYQHFETFKQRFSAFPVKIDMISRFRTPKEQKEVVALSEKGEIDVLIGTHRILSNDVKLPKLGLVIVDEEQRFGVAHKEKLKQLKKKVDVLTLTATPIPRTLNMAMIGMRDMSIIETPPRDRLAINTQVVQFSEAVIKSAIELELSRDGQVFFIHNRVQTIDAIAAHVQKIVPNARIVIGHGQMSEKELERVMLDFVDYKYDVLVATTIIENGIDIPRSNTIIINRADTYGLSQLYQLRGRVGRSSRRAYSYLLIPGERELTPVARRRLSAIREFSDLGAGFRIAALDLELRGAGNILSGKQSGHIDSLGFDLYSKMLNRTIQELRGEEIEDETSVSLNLGVDVSIPQEYINETSQRLRTYKRISSAGSDGELRQIYSEIQDRYGKMPESVENLFEFARLRQTAEALHIISVDKTKDGLAIKLAEKSLVSPEKLMELVQSNPGSAFSPNGILRVPTNETDIIDEGRAILERIKQD